MVGDLFSLPGSSMSEVFQPVFSEFLKRLTDRTVEVRMSVLVHVKSCLLSNPLRVEASEIICKYYIFFLSAPLFFLLFFGGGGGQYIHVDCCNLEGKVSSPYKRTNVRSELWPFFFSPSLLLVTMDGKNGWLQNLVVFEDPKENITLNYFVQRV